MPLKPGKNNVSSNIREMLNSDTFVKGKSGKKRRQMAVAAAMGKARKSKARRTLRIKDR